MPFSSLGLSPALLHAVGTKGYLAPTPIQTAAIPAILQGRDVLGSAQTGSGKTAAFVLPLLQQLLAGPHEKPRSVRALVLVPTRELAAQVGETMRSLAQQLPQALKVATVFGGVSINPQMMNLRGGADIVVATPGRLLDLVDQNALVLSGVKALVLDEADRLFELGFAEELGRILALLAPQRQNLFFSATLQSAVQALAQTHVSAEQAAIIYAMEPVFAALFAWIYLAELMTPMAQVGAVVVVVAVVLSQRPSAGPAGGTAQALSAYLPPK